MEKEFKSLHYNYTSSKAYCEQIGLIWLGDDFVRNADEDAFNHGFTQEQVDIAMRHHLWQVKWLFTPKNYGFIQRIGIALYFLFGGSPQ